jgi:hypothetical protein
MNGIRVQVQRNKYVIILGSLYVFVVILRRQERVRV